MKSCPNYLTDYADLWSSSPREANKAWFKDAAFGLFIHYGLYAQEGRGEWVQYQEQIPVADYDRLTSSFDPRNFDVEWITDLALDAGMKYVNLTTCHHEGFCLWDSQSEPFNSQKAAGRDLVLELAKACDRKGLGFFSYFTFALNWRHPDAMSRRAIPFARPDYAVREERYREEDPQDVSRFWEWSHTCLRELCELDAPLAGIWLDIIMAYYERPDLIPIEETYALIRELRPEAMISFKQGATGTEDFAAPEFHFASLAERLLERGDQEGAARAEKAWQANKDKHNEICMTLQEQGWGYNRESAHKDSETIWRNLAYARANHCNLLANVGPLPDGSIHPDDMTALREVGQRIREHGLPEAADALAPDARTDAGAL